jgi:hypothetical protein
MVTTMEGKVRTSSNLKHCKLALRTGLQMSMPVPTLS